MPASGAIESNAANIYKIILLFDFTIKSPKVGDIVDVWNIFVIYPDPELKSNAGVPTKTPPSVELISKTELHASKANVLLPSNSHLTIVTFFGSIEYNGIVHTKTQSSTFGLPYVTPTTSVVLKSFIFA